MNDHSVATFVLINRQGLNMTNTILNQTPNLVNPSASMTSREIAELTGKQHCHVIRDIRKMLHELYINDDSKMDHKPIQGVAISKDERGYTKEFCLDKDHTFTLLTGYDVTARMKIIQRWQELEASKPQVALPQTYIEALEALLAAEKARQALAHDNALLNTIIDNEFGYASIIRAAQHLGVHESTFSWRLLKKATLVAGLEIKKVPSPRFEYQLLYPISIFQQCYPNYDFSSLQPQTVATQSVKLLGGQVMSVYH